MGVVGFFFSSISFSPIWYEIGSSPIVHEWVHPLLLAVLVSSLDSFTRPADFFPSFSELALVYIGNLLSHISPFHPSNLLNSWSVYPKGREKIEICILFLLCFHFNTSPPFGIRTGKTFYSLSWKRVTMKFDIFYDLSSNHPFKLLNSSIVLLVLFAWRKHAQFLSILPRVEFSLSRTAGGYGREFHQMMRWRIVHLRKDVADLK